MLGSAERRKVRLISREIILEATGRTADYKTLVHTLSETLIHLLLHVCCQTRGR